MGELSPAGATGGVPRNYPSRGIWSTDILDLPIFSRSQYTYISCISVYA